MKNEITFTHKYYLFTILSVVLFVAMAHIIWEWGYIEGTNINVLHQLNRLLNAIFSVVVACMTFVITLTANLYTPRLAKLFFLHPIFLSGLSFIVFSCLSIILGDIVPPEHPYYAHTTKACILLTSICLAGIMPFLYHIGQFLRPSYFLPMLGKQSFNSVKKLRKGNIADIYYQRLILNIDVFANVAITSCAKDNRRLMNIVMNIMHELLYEIIKTSSDIKNQPWRKSQQKFIMGLEENGKHYLTYTFNWPEAYILGKQLQAIKGVQGTQNEVIANVCQNLEKTLELALETNREGLIQLHLMIYNTIAHNAVLKKDIERFQLLSYYYVRIIPLLKDHPQILEMAFSSWFHYANEAFTAKVHYAFETVMYDLGKLLVDACKIDEKFAINLLNKHIKNIWDKALADKHASSEFALKSIIKTYWHSFALENKTLAAEIQKNYLQDETKHREVLKTLTVFHTPLHWEFNNRFMRFSCVPNVAIPHCEAFLNPHHLKIVA